MTFPNTTEQPNSKPSEPIDKMDAERTQKPDKGYTTRRKVLGGISLVVFVALIGALSYFVYKMFLKDFSDPEQLSTYIHSFGWKGRFVFLGLQVLQVFIALIPGEFVEVGAGFVFGALEGTILCLVGVAIASTMVFLLTKKLGVKLVEIFISKEKINEFRFINSEKKLKRTIFILFFIPGTPKDLLTYLAGLTQISLLEFLTISLLARVPSIVTSTVAGHFLGENNMKATVITFAITGLVSVIGLLIYNRIIKYKQKRRELKAVEADDLNDIKNA